MEVKIDNQHYSVANNFDDLETFWNNLNSELLQNRLIIKEIYIDDVPVYRDFYAAIKSNIESIARLNIVLTSQLEACRELAQSLFSYLDKLPPHLEDLANDFYSGPSAATWDKFQQLLEGIGWIVDAAVTLSQYLDTAGNQPLASATKEIQKTAEDMLQAVDVRDYFQLGDILQYDLMEKVDMALKTVSSYLETGRQ